LPINQYRIEKNLLSGLGIFISISLNYCSTLIKSNMKNTYTSGLFSGILLFMILLAGSSIHPLQTLAAVPEGTIIRGERPPIDITSVPDEAMVQGIIRIKFNKTLENLLDNGLISNNPDGTVRFGISGIDQLNQQFGVSEVKKTFDAALQNTKYTERHRLWGFHLWYDLIVPAGTDIRSMVMAYSAKNEIQISEPLYKKQLIGADINPLQSSSPAGGDAGLSYVPNDPRYNEQWHYHNTGQQSGTADADIDLPEAWDITRGSTSVVVAIIDGGIDYVHPDLAANMWPGIGYNFVTNTPAVSAHDHGTHVAGTVAANTNNAVGVSGVAGGNGTGNGVRLMSCQVFTNGGSGGFENAPVYAADNDAAISQNSWGYTSPGVFDQAVLDAIDYFNTNGGGAVMNGGITIFAAGNSNSTG
jgi:subtilisin family serine protease